MKQHIDLPYPFCVCVRVCVCVCVRACVRACICGVCVCVCGVCMERERERELNSSPPSNQEWSSLVPQSQLLWVRNDKSNHPLSRQGLGRVKASRLLKIPVATSWLFNNFTANCACKRSPFTYLWKNLRAAGGKKHCYTCSRETCEVWCVHQYIILLQLFALVRTVLCFLIDS